MYSRSWPVKHEQLFKNMSSRLCIILMIICLFFGSKGDNADTSYYTAGVVEFRPTVRGMPSSDLVADHLQAYLNIIEAEEANDTDIIIFPEGTLNNALQLTYVPDSKDGTVPCLTMEKDLYANFLIELSCAARRTHKYLVINLTEKENCSSVPQDPRHCASNGLNIYNTNVVFDREGRVVSRYRKVHVYLENKNTTYEPEYAIFDTDFGVRFGHFICFDMLFYTPAQELVERFGITNFIFTSFFYSELPFLTAVQLQHGWAWGNNVNLLAAGASYPQSGTTGSGIFAGNQGDLISIMVRGEGERKLYKARVPKNGHTSDESRIIQPRNNQSYIHLLKDPQLKNFNSVVVDVKLHKTFSQQLCHGDLCCKFEIIIDFLNSSMIDSVYYTYRVGVFDGRRTYEKEEWSDIKVCALYACTNENINSCGELLVADHLDPVVIFKKISIGGTFTKSNKMLIMPTSIDDQFYPMKTNLVSWNKIDKGNKYEVNFTLTKDQSNIMAFGIYGNYYEKSSAISHVLINNFEFRLILLILFKVVYQIVFI